VHRPFHPGQHGWTAHIPGTENQHRSILYISYTLSMMESKELSA